MSDYYKKLCESVFAISAEQRCDFCMASGHELLPKVINGKMSPPKMQAKFSSSALALNMLGPISNCKLPGSCWDELFALRGFFGNREVETHFEKKLRVPAVRGYAPNLDFFITCGPRCVGVESKYHEMYHRKHNQTVQEQYIDRFEWWSEFEGLRIVADKVSDYTGGGRLDAAQLVKHCLALISSAKRNGNDGKFRLVYIYHDIVDEKIAKEHKEGLDKFVETANLGRRFLHLKYSQFLGRLKSFLPQIYDRENYIKFLVHRYVDLRVEELLVH